VGNDRIAPFVRCKAKPVSDGLARGEPLDLNGGMRRKVHDGEYNVIGVPECGAGAGGGGVEEGTVLWPKQDTLEDVVAGAEPQDKAIGGKDRKGRNDWDGRESPKGRRRGAGRAGAPLGERVHACGDEHGDICCDV
jgi:hypothetical protein